MSTHNLCFEQKYEKYQNFYLKIFIFLVVKFSIYLNRHVFLMCVIPFRIYFILSSYFSKQIFHASRIH